MFFLFRLRIDNTWLLSASNHAIQYLISQFSDPFLNSHLESPSTFPLHLTILKVFQKQWRCETKKEVNDEKTNHRRKTVDTH